MSRPWYEAAFAELYPLVYGHRDDREARRAAETIARYLGGSEPVLDLACGDGRYLDAFREQLVGIVGADLSIPLLERAIDRPGVAGTVVCGDMRSIPLLDRSVGAVVSMFTSFGYFETDAENLSVVREVARVLRSGGMFVLDFLNAGLVKEQPAASGEREVNGYRIAEDRSVDPGGRYAFKRVVITDNRGVEVSSYQERVRLFTARELEDLVTGADLFVSTVLGDYDGGPFSEWSSPRTILICRRK